jgi:protein-tyrosine phosphatase
VPQYLPQIGGLQGLLHLKLNSIGLEHFPGEILSLRQLTRLDLYENKLAALPPNIGDMQQLAHLDLDHNRLVELPESILRATALTALSIKDNHLTSLPQLNILPELKKLKINRNHLDLSKLPPGLNSLLVSFGAQYVPSLIEPRLYLGSYVSAQNLTMLQKLEITHILTLSKEAPPFFPTQFTYKIIMVDDLVSVDLSPYFPEAIEFISMGLQKGSVLVHCKQGVSRSASAVIAYLMAKRNKTYEQAFDWVFAARRCVNPNPSFRQQLQNFEGQLRPQADTADTEAGDGGLALDEEASPLSESSDAPAEEKQEKRDRKEKKGKKSRKEKKEKKGKQDVVEVVPALELGLVPPSPGAKPPSSPSSWSLESQLRERIAEAEQALRSSLEAEFAQLRLQMQEGLRKEEEAWRQTLLAEQAAQRARLREEEERALQRMAALEEAELQRKRATAARPVSAEGESAPLLGRGTTGQAGGQAEEAGCCSCPQSWCSVM